MASSCGRCGESLPVAGRGRVPKYCSTRCRVAAHRDRHRVPRELVERDRWVRRSRSKVPLTTAGRAASSTDPKTWCSYREASKSEVGAGLGFVLNGDGVACIDLDDCLDGDRVAPWAQDILDRLPPTWIQVSASGRGLHVWGLARVERGRKLRTGDRRIEVYGDMRYMAITGRTFGDMPRRLADISEAVASLL